jgi:hypothetical protein
VAGPWIGHFLLEKCQRSGDDLKDGPGAAERSLKKVVQRGRAAPEEKPKAGMEQLRAYRRSHQQCGRYYDQERDFPQSGLRLVRMF